MDSISSVLKELDILKQINEDLPNKYELKKYEFSTFEFGNASVTCELKVKDCVSSKYKTVNVSLNKVRVAAKDTSKTYKFYYLFSDGLFCWDFNWDQVQIGIGGRSDKYRRELKKFASVSRDHLNLV